MMPCVPSARLLAPHCAVRLLPTPLKATALQPATETAAIGRLTLPVGAAPDTIAVRVTLTPTTDGFAELDKVVVDDVSPPRHEGNLNDPIRVCQLPLLPFVWLL